MRKTKIICTMGPSTDKGEVLKQLVVAGMDVARFNFSHGDYDEHSRRIDKLKLLREQYKRPIAIVLDTKGPEIRIGRFKNGSIVLTEGQNFTLYIEDKYGDENGVSVSCKNLYKDIKIGDRLLFDDGMIISSVEDIKNTDIVCRIVNSGRLSDRKGVNIPNKEINMEYISQKDREDIIFGIGKDVDFIAASFTRTKQDVLDIRKLLDDNGGEQIKIIAKIENIQGVNNIDDIVGVADGIMIARGDLGVELDEEEVPVIQKKIIKKVVENGKTVITATQMLESMIVNPRPTRAETADIANAIYDGTCAIMLSGETAAGKYPIESFNTMNKIALRTEADIDYVKRFDCGRRKLSRCDVTEAICHATCTTALDLRAKAILVVTESGYSAKMISRHRPTSMIIGCSVTDKVARQLNLSWGITPITLKNETDIFTLFMHAVNEAKEKKFLQVRDIVVITAGVPLGLSGTTNLIKVHEVE